MSSTVMNTTRKLRSSDPGASDDLPQDDGIVGKTKSNEEATVSAHGDRQAISQWTKNNPDHTHFTRF